MKKKRRKFTAQFKLKVILEALRERQGLSALAQKYELHPNQISKWKSDFLDNARGYMQKTNGDKSEDQQVEIKELYAKIGQLQMQIDFLKKKLD